MNSIAEEDITRRYAIQQNLTESILNANWILQLDFVQYLSKSA